MHIAPPSEFQHKVETLDHEKFNVAKHINNVESTCQALERTYASVMAQRAALEQIEAMYRQLDEVECAIAKQLKRDSPAYQDASLQHFPALQEKVAHSHAQTPACTIRTIPTSGVNPGACIDSAALHDVTYFFTASGQGARRADP